MITAIRNWRKKSKSDLLERAKTALRDGNYQQVYSSLAKLSGVTEADIRRAFRVRASLTGKTPRLLLKEALDEIKEP